MFGTYFYHEILRKVIISFGTMFNGLVIKKDNDGDKVFSEIRVPLAYGPTQKFLARLEQDATLKKGTQISLPRMSFEFLGLQYDQSRKLTTTQTFVTRNADSDKTGVKKAFMPVPYNMSFELSIYTKLNDDMLQILEQILPNFQPGYTVSIKLLEDVAEKRDVPIILENISMQDDYEGDFSTRRALIYTLRFSAKTYLFGPVSSTGIIKKTIVDYTTRPDMNRELRYTAVPRAIKDYTGDVATNTTQDIDLAATLIKVQDSSSLSADTYIDVNGEQMFIKSISGTDVTVERGKDNTTIKEHVSGSPIKNITAADTALIEVGDDFGFDGNFEEFI